MSEVLRALRTRLLSWPALGVAVAVLSVVGVGFAFFGGSSDRVVVVNFKDAAGLVQGNEVRIAGLEAGTVKTLRIEAEDVADPQHAGQVIHHKVAQATLEINADHWPLHADDLIEVRPKGVLSNVYVSITPGSARANVLDTSKPITSDRTRTPINLDALQDVFTQPVRDSIRTQLQQGVIAFGNGGAQNLGQTLTNLNPLTADLAPITQVLADRSPELHRLNGEFATVSAELTADDAALRGLIENSNTLFAAIAARQNELRGTLDHAASVLSQVDTALQGEEPNLISFFQKLPSTLDKTTHSNQLLYPLVHNVNPHIPNLNTLLDYFVTANGFLSQNGVYSLRVDASLPPQGKAATSCGGEPTEQKGCPSNVSQSNSPPQTAAGSSSGTSTSAPASSPPTQPFLGGLFG